MHDVGKIGIPDRILLKPGRLTEDERKVMEAHTEMGHRILAGSEVELLELAAEMALTHHERIDGSGYPAGTAGDAIPIEGRICAIADVFDALTSDRVYRRPSTGRGPRADVEGRGTQFDAELLDLFFGAFDDVLAIRRAAGTGTVEQTLAIALAHASGHRAG
jgi:putative two-component system response regulator